MYVNASIGIWPLIYEKQPVRSFFYRFYGKCLFISLVYFTVCCWLEGYLIVKQWSQGSEEELGQLFNSFCITLLYTVALARSISLRGPTMTGLIKEILVQEERMYRSEDEEVIQIYNGHVYLAHRSDLVYFIAAMTVLLLYYISPLTIKFEVFDEATNSTVILRPITQLSWVPWDEQMYYWTTYTWHSIAGATGTFYVAFTDMLLYCLIIFPLGQINILIHMLKNFDRYSKKVQGELGCSPDEASFITLRECILKHKEIIRYINQYNDGIRTVTFCDFITNSLQLASTALHMLQVDTSNVLVMINWSVFVTTILIRLMTYYYYANELMLQSSNIGNAIWESKWYEEPQKVKQMMIIMIMRSNKALALVIGPFTTMTLSTFQGILKGAYSYMMLMYR